MDFLIGKEMEEEIRKVPSIEKQKFVCRTVRYMLD